LATTGSSDAARQTHDAAGRAKMRDEVSRWTTNWAQQVGETLRRDAVTTAPS